MTTTTFDLVAEFIAAADLAELNAQYAQAREDEAHAWREANAHTVDDGFTVSEWQVYSMKALAASRHVKDLYEAREDAYRALNMPVVLVNASEEFEYDDPDPRSDLYYSL